MVKPKIFVSVSGGRTSGYMAKLIKDNLSNTHEIVNLFANTGLEHEDTLRFINDIDIHFGLNLVWVEAVVNHDQRKATSHKVVDYQTASRSGEPMADVISKYGIPNVKWLHCTRETKLNPMKSYIKSIGWEDHMTAVGIRNDELRRVSATADKVNIIYPLVDMWPSDKQDVLDFWEDYSWDLAIPEWQGNCQACYKKSYKKLAQVYKETPEAFNFTRRMEKDKGRVGPEFKKNTEASDRVFFRQGLSTNALICTFDADVDATRYISQTDSGCSESCELYPTD